MPSSVAVAGSNHQNEGEIQERIDEGLEGLREEMRRMAEEVGEKVG